MTAAAGLSLLLLAGCSSSSGGGSSDASVCADALDEADHGYDVFADDIDTVRQAFDQAFAGNLDAASATLDRVQRVSPDTYKRLEAECRDAVG